MSYELFRFSPLFAEFSHCIHVSFWICLQTFSRNPFLEKWISPYDMNIFRFLFHLFDLTFIYYYALDYCVTYTLFVFHIAWSPISVNHGYWLYFLYVPIFHRCVDCPIIRQIHIKVFIFLTMIDLPSIIQSNLLWYTSNAHRFNFFNDYFEASIPAMKHCLIF